MLWDDSTERGRVPVERAWDLFRRFMFGKRSLVFYSDAAKLAVVSANAARDGSHRVLLIESSSFVALDLSAVELELYVSVGIADEVERIRRLLWAKTPSLPSCDWQLCSHACLTQGSHLLALEAALCPRPLVTIGIIRGVGGQKDEGTMMKNEGQTPLYSRMLSILHGPDAVKGDDFVMWRGFQFSIFDATSMDATEQRQHIGNAAVLLYVLEGDADITPPVFRGAVNATAMLLHVREEGLSSVSGFHRAWMKDDFRPSWLPSDEIGWSQEAEIRRVVFSNALETMWCSGCAKTGPYANGRARAFEDQISSLIRMENASFVPNKGSLLIDAQESTRRIQSGPSSLHSSTSSVTGKLVVEDSRSGWMMRLEGSGWEKRFCIFRAGALNVYKRSDDEDSRFLVIPVWSMSEVTVGPASKAAVQCTDASLRMGLQTLKIVTGTGGLQHEFCNVPHQEGERDVITSFRFSITLAKQSNDAKVLRLHHEGYLLKRKDKSKNTLLKVSTWKKRWCILDRDQLRWYDKPSASASSAAVGAVSLADVECSKNHNDAGDEIMVFADGGDTAYQFICVAEYGDSIQTWLDCIARIKATTLAKQMTAGVSKSSDWPPIPEGRMPDFLRSAFDVLREQVTTVPGIFRVSGDQEDVATLVAQWKEKKTSTVAALRGVDIHTLAGAFKRFFRDLTPPLLSFSSYGAFLEASKLPDSSAKLEQCVKLIAALPLRTIALELFSLLAMIVENSAVTLMDAKVNTSSEMFL